MGKRSSSDKRQPLLFDPSELPISDLPAEPALKPIDNRVGTQNKARFIMRYLRYFVYITRHGTYIDGFAGSQQEEEPECWAAKLVLNSEPRWLRHFHLCDASKSQVNYLRRRKFNQPTHDSRGNVPLLIP